MKIGILTHFGSFQDGYALHVGWLERAKLLEYFKQDFDFLVNQRCTSDIYPHIKKVLLQAKSGQSFQNKAKHYESQYREILTEYDAILTADLIYQRRGDFLAQNQAMRKVAPDLKAHWYHWIHSSWTNPPKNLNFPDSLRFTPMEKSTIVYMNSSEKAGVARMYSVPIEDVACVYNPKDIRSFADFHPLSWEIINKLKIPEKDAVQILPHCSTRMDAKGVDVTIKAFAAFKRNGLKVALVFANANARQVPQELLIKKNFMTSQGLIENEDFLFTSDLNENRPLPRKAVSDIFRVSNVFVYATYSEVSPNALMEAKISGNLLVLSNRLPSLAEFGGPNAIYFDASFRTPGVPSGEEGDLQTVTYHNETTYFDELTKRIVSQLPSRKHLWEFSYERIWNEQLKPLLYGEKK